MGSGPASTPSGRSRRGAWIAVIAGLACLAIGVWFVSVKLPRWLATPGEGEPAESASAAAPSAAAPAAAGDARKIHVTLFYVSADGTELVPVSREVPYGATPSEQARRIAEAQFAPAPDGLLSPVPAGTTVRSIFLTPRGEAYLDLSQEIRTGHTGGSLDEALTVFAIVDALTLNLPDVSSVQILVDGQEVDTLVGHLDLRHPLARSLKWVKKGE